MGVRTLTRRAKYLWLAVPALGLAELGASVYFSQRAPQLEEWRALASEVRARKKDGDLIVIAPEWAEPLARTALTDSLLPIADVARPDESGYARALEIAELDRENPLLSTWPLISEERLGKFSLRTRKNPHFDPPSFVLTDHALPPDLSVVERGPNGESWECRYGTWPASSASGLLARPAFPRQRFSCGPSEGNFVGPTIIEDQHDRARRCLWANPAAGDLLTLSFANVPLAGRLDGYIGFPYFRFRDHGWPKVTVAFAVDGTALGSHEHSPESGWQPFQLSTERFRGTSHEVRIQIFGADSRELELCFYAAIR